MGFYVVDEGMATEIAYWHGSEPKPAPPAPGFDAELRAWLDTKVADDTILFYNVIGILPAIERARVDVVLKQVDTYVEKKLGIFKNAQGQFEYVVIS